MRLDGRVPTYVALIRGINVGRHNRIGMARLRELLAGLGYAEVRTVLASGNAIFTSGRRSEDAVRREIEPALRSELGKDVRVVVRTAAAYRAAIEANDLVEPGRDPTRLMVCFLSARPARAALPNLDREQVEPEQWQVRGREVYLWLPDGLLASTLINEFTDERLGVAVTTRNWATALKVAARVDDQVG